MKKITWRGREWTIRPATEAERDAMDNDLGRMSETNATIIYDDTKSEDLQIMTILHEVGHVMFPEWAAEPDQTSKSELGIFERDIKSLCDEAGVDLTALLEDDSDAAAAEED